MDFYTCLQSYNHESPISVKSYVSSTRFLSPLIKHFYGKKSVVQHSCKKVVRFATHEHSRIKMSAALFSRFGIIVLLFVLCPLDQLKKTLQTEAATEVSRNRSRNATKASENTCNISISTRRTNTFVLLVLMFMLMSHF